MIIVLHNSLSLCNKSKKDMVYPSATAAPSIATEFVNGIKFDICEVDKAAYNMLYNKANRFFLCVDDNIVGIESAEKFAAATGEVRWDLFCCTKSDCLSKIKAFQADLETLQKWQNKPGYLAQKISSDIISRCKAAYKVSPI